MVFYGKAREHALIEITIISAFAKTGIWPVNCHALDRSVIEPSKNTTTDSSKPLPAKLPALIPIKVSGDADPNHPGFKNEARYIIPLPPALRPDMTFHDNQMLRYTLRLAVVQLEKDFTQMILMDSENGCLRKEPSQKRKRFWRNERPLRHMLA